MVSLEYVFSFKPNDFCFVSEKTCTGKYDSKNRYKIECKKSKCETPLSFQCDDNYCAVSEAACDKLMEINYLFKIYLKSSVSNFKFQKGYRHFFHNVRNCSQKQYEWNPNDVCINGKNCYHAHSSSMRLLGKVKLFIPINCPCPKDFTYRCGTTYCVTHQRACDELTLNLDELNLNLTNISSIITNNSDMNLKDCGNSNQRV